jgi:translocator protein
MKIIKLIASILLCLSAGIIGSIFTVQNIPTWYTNLIKPVFSPPNWIFAPVWTTLYILMGIALYLIWEKGFKKEKNKQAIIIFMIQLGLNTIWSLVFFSAHLLLTSYIVIVLLWLTIILTINKFLKISKIAGLLLTPYILWVTFASFLNLAIYLLNR